MSEAKNFAEVESKGILDNKVNKQIGNHARIFFNGVVDIHPFRIRRPGTIPEP